MKMDIEAMQTGVSPTAASSIEASSIEAAPTAGSGDAAMRIPDAGEEAGPADLDAFATQGDCPTELAEEMENDPHSDSEMIDVDGEEYGPDDDEYEWDEEYEQLVTLASTPAELEAMLLLRETPVGTGVFANRDFEPGQTIAIVSGKLIYDPHYDSRYCVEMSAEYSFEPHAPFRFLNHCCKPNCLFRSLVDDDEFAAAAESGEFPDLLALEVMEPISAGEQLTIDYQWPAESAIPCGCGVENCRGWVVDADDLHRVAEFHDSEGSQSAD